MFRATAAFYDAVYGFKDYAAEAALFAELIRARNPAARTLLDVACGTGQHLEHFRRDFEVEGLDLDPALLAIARERLPGVPLHEGDMRAFDLGRTFDAVTVLFSSIGYALDLVGLERTAERLAAHLAPGGVLVIEPWLEPEEFTDGYLGSLFVDRPDLKIARFNTSRKEGRLSVMQFEYLIGTPQGFERMSEEHRLGLFTAGEQRGALERQGLRVEHDPGGGPMGRGLFVGVLGG